jgi:solute carrier family 35 (UDP-sugar transporter), member A1/2/3
VVQNAATILLLRYVRTQPGDMFFATTAIVCQEVIKMFTSVILCYMESSDFNEFLSIINQQILKNKWDCIKTGIPALLYTIQTNLVYLAISNLDPAVFQVTFQIKILTTALFMVILLNRSLRLSQWISLLLLTIGISIIQIQNVKSKGGVDLNDQKNAIFGLICVVMACVLSGLAGVYFEKILKNSKVSIWVRNIQLGLFGTMFALLTVYFSDFENIVPLGFFYGYTKLVWVNILVQSAGGLLVAVVIKYADNILKGFATSIAIIVSCLASVYLFNTFINSIFVFGTFLVVLSVVLYSYAPTSIGASKSSALLPTSSSSSSSSPDQQQLLSSNSSTLSSALSSLSSSPKPDEPLTSSNYDNEKSKFIGPGDNLIQYKLNSIVVNDPQRKNITIDMSTMPKNSARYN